MSKHQQFWNEEYKTSKHLALSDEPAEDLEKFCRWLERQSGKRFLNVTAQALDLGSGNGRNLIYLAKTYGMRAVGYDISDVAVKQAVRASEGLPIKYVIRSMQGVLDLPDNSVTLILDMMSSHFLKTADRNLLRDEIFRVLKPGGWLFFKSFTAEGDLHVPRLLREHPADEPSAYIHPEFKVYEYVWTDQALFDFFEPKFVIHKLEHSHKHIMHGRAFKRRTVTAYLEKPL
jgi:SAM-dependent methyltransferase